MLIFFKLAEPKFGHFLYNKTKMLME